jgi:predicted ATPase
VRQILSKSEQEVSHWREAILEAVGPTCQLMVNLIPELELVIGKQPPVPELPLQAAQKPLRSGAAAQQKVPNAIQKALEIRLTPNF